MGVPLRDEHGKLLGYFLTEAEHTRLEYDLAFAEFERQKAEDRANGVVRKWDGTNGKTTAEAIAWLKAQRPAGGGS